MVEQDNNESSQGLNDEIGERVRVLRKSYGLTRDDFAARFLVSSVVISEIEKGNVTPSGPLIVLMEEIFMSERSWILTGRGSMIREREPDHGPGVTTEEDCIDTVELVKGFRGLSFEGQKKIMKLIKVFMTIERLPDSE